MKAKIRAMFFYPYVCERIRIVYTGHGVYCIYVVCCDTLIAL